MSNDRRETVKFFNKVQGWYNINSPNVSVKSKLQHAPPPPQGIPRAFDTFAVPGRREFDYQSLQVKSLAWRGMGDAVLEDFRGKDCAFVANWLRGKGLNKPCGVFELFKF